MGPFTHLWQDLFWVDLLWLVGTLRNRAWDHIDVLWFLLRLTCKPVVAAPLGTT